MDGNAPVRTDATTQGHSHHWCPLLPSSIFHSSWKQQILIALHGNFSGSVVFASHCLRRRQHWVSTEVMASSDDDDQMLSKVEDILAATATEHVVCQLCDEVIPEGCKSLSHGLLFGCKTLGKRCWAALKSFQRLTQKNPDMKAKVDRCMASHIRCERPHRDSPRAPHRHSGKDQREHRGQDDREIAVVRSLWIPHIWRGIFRTQKCCVGEEGCSCRMHWRGQRRIG